MSNINNNNNIDSENNDNRRMMRPEWLKVRAPGGESFVHIKNMMRSKKLHTVCEEAHCPNMGECWGCGTATFMILGDTCVRNCRFCAIKTGKPDAPDANEPFNVAESIKQMNLKHAVITSVTRDDLSDCGSGFWAEVIRKVKDVNPNTSLEVLIPDFRANHEFLQKVIDAQPDILNHNIETVPRLYAAVRPQADYQQSLDVLEYCKQKGMRTKTGMMLGLGESKDEVVEVFKDLKKINVDIVTLGQYLQPTQQHVPVVKFVTPEEFQEFKEIGLAMGFRHVESAPLVRSSYHAAKHME